jgi:hypothetical protein
MSRCEDALPIYTALARGSRGADAQRFAAGVARCKAADTSRPPRSEAKPSEGR